MRLFSKLFGLFPAECQLECQSFRFYYLRNIFPTFDVGSVATSSTPKMLESFISWPLIFGYLVLRKRDEKHSTAEHVFMKKIFIRACVNKDFVHSSLIGLI